MTDESSPGEEGGEPRKQGWVDGPSVRAIHPPLDRTSPRCHTSPHHEADTGPALPDPLPTGHGAAAGSGAGTEEPPSSEASSSPTAMPRRLETYTAATMIPMATTATSARTQGFASAP